MLHSPLSDTEYEDNLEAAMRYYEDLYSPEGAEALAYLTEERGLTEESIQNFGLGLVVNPMPGHEHLRGRVAIPYRNMRGVTALRFRGMPGQEGTAKYLDLPGAKPLMFNIETLARGGDLVVICEGEIDCITAHQMGLVAVGISGALKWQPHYRHLLEGFSSVVVLCDSDDKGAGMALGDAVKTAMPDTYVSIKPSPEGHDVNSAYKEMGQEALLNYWNLEVQ